MPTGGAFRSGACPTFMPHLDASARHVGCRHAWKAVLQYRLLVRKAVLRGPKAALFGRKAVLESGKAVLQYPPYSESVAPKTEPQCRLPSPPRRGEDSPPNPKSEELLRRSGHDLVLADRAIVLTAINRALTDGHRDQTVADALSAPIGGLNHPGLGLAGRLAPEKLGPPPPPPVPGSMTHDQARKQPPCEHGRPGGHVLNAASGTPWCPTCRQLAAAGKPYGPAPEPPVEQSVSVRNVVGLISGADLSETVPSDDVKRAAAIKAGCCPTYYLAGQSVIAVPGSRSCRVHAA